jgi:hypothetical protein
MFVGADAKNLYLGMWKKRYASDLSGVGPFLKPPIEK